MATNTRDLLNKVLYGIRQFGLVIGSSTTSTTDSYLLMLLQIVNEAKEEVEECGWPWRALRQTVTITLSSGTAAYDITTAGSVSDVSTTERSRLLYENVAHGGPSEGFYISTESRPQLFNTTTSSEYRLTEVPQETMERWHFTDNDETGRPTHFALYQDSDSLVMKIYPTPDATYTLKGRFYIPQAALSSTDLTTNLTVPARAVWMRALFKANEERGSELGRPGSSLYLAMLDAHGAAVGKEMTAADQTVYLER